MFDMSTEWDNALIRLKFLDYAHATNFTIIPPILPQEQSGLKSQCILRRERDKNGGLGLRKKVLILFLKYSLALVLANNCALCLENMKF